MRKYVPIGYTDGWGSGYARETVQIIEPVSKTIDTGLLDVRGVKLYRIEEPNPVGFTAKIKD